jgi:hypothetical protein
MKNNFIEIQPTRQRHSCLINLDSIVVVDVIGVDSPDKATTDLVTRINFGHGHWRLDYSRDYAAWIYLLTGHLIPYETKQF